jgi:hypothetical protein
LGLARPIGSLNNKIYLHFSTMQRDINENKNKTLTLNSFNFDSHGDITNQSITYCN